MKPLELKTRSWQIKALDDERGIIEAYGSVFNNVDQGDDIVRRGAFKRTIQNAKARVQSGNAKFLAPMLWQHNPAEPIGGWIDMREDEHGLLCKGQIILETDLGRNVYQLIKAGVIQEFSIGYDVPKGGAKYEKDTGYRELLELRLWEVSPVTFAMNPEALLQSVKNNAMTNKEHKDFADHYRQERIEDWLYSDFNNLTSALKASIIDIFSIGDTPQTDAVNTILNDTSANTPGFISALKNYVQMGIDLDVSNYLQETLEAHGPNGIRGYMGRDTDHMHVKAGRAISAANAERINTHIQNMHDMADKAMSHANAMQEHAKAMHTAADDLATVLQGSEAAYGSDSGTPEDGHQEGKSAPYDGTRAATPSSSKDTTDEQELLAALQKIRSFKK